jgi:WD40 repeat protein
MNEQLRQKLCDIVAAHGAGVADDPGRCGELLRHAAPEDGAGVEALLRALEARVPARLALLTEPLAMAPLTSGLVRRLVDEQGLSEEAARWAVESWAAALGKGDAAAAAGGLPAYEHVLAPPRRRWRFLWYLLPALAVAAALAGWWWSGQRAELRRFGGRNGGVYYLSLNADGHRLLGACGDGLLRLWDVDSGEEDRPIKPVLKNVFDAALSPDGRLALWCGGAVKSENGKYVPEDCAVRGRNLETGSDFPEPFDKAEVPFYCVAFSPDGRLALAGLGDYEHKEGESAGKDKKPLPKDCVVRLYEVTRKPMTLSAFGASTVGLLGSPNGEGPLLAASALFPGRTTALRDLKGHDAPVWRAVFTPDGRRVVSAGMDGTLRLWDVADGHELKRVEVRDKAHVVSLAVSPDGRRLLTGDNQARLTLWDLDELEPQREIKCSGQVVAAVAFSPDGRRALSGGDDYMMRLWDAETLTELRHFPGHTSSVYGVAFLDDGRRALSGSSDGTIRVWKLP